MAFIDLRYVMQQWESVGVFDILLPMMLVFALVFAILQRIKILGARKGIDAIVAMVISVFAILNPAVSMLFRVIFEKSAIAISMLLVCFLIAGVIMPKKPGWWQVFGGILGISFIIWVITQVADYYEMYFGVSTILSQRWFTDNMSWIIAILFIVIFAVIVIASGNDKPIDAKTSIADILKDAFKETNWHE